MLFLSVCVFHPVWVVFFEMTLSVCILLCIKLFSRHLSCGCCTQWMDIPALVMRFCMQLTLQTWSHDAFVSEHSKTKQKVLPVGRRSSSAVILAPRISSRTLDIQCRGYWEHLSTLPPWIRWAHLAAAARYTASGHFASRAFWRC